MITRIDAHQHFWQIARGDYAWLRPDVPELAPLYRDFMPDDLRRMAAAAGVTRTVLVQAAESEAETEFLLDLASRHDFIGAVVGWVDVSRAGAVATLDRWRAHPAFRSIRPMLQDVADADWIAHAPNPAVIDALMRHGIVFDALVRPWHLAGLLRFVEAHPDLPLVIDHAAKPQLAQGWNADWADAWWQGMQALARHPQVCCKVSGLLTEAPAAALRTVAAGLEAVRPVWDALLQWFGPQRLMWGSDWPVLTLAADYGRWLAVSDALIGELGKADQDRVRRGNACAFYGMSDQPGRGDHPGETRAAAVPAPGR